MLFVSLETLKIWCCKQLFGRNQNAFKTVRYFGFHQVNFSEKHSQVWDVHDGCSSQTHQTRTPPCYKKKQFRFVCGAEKLTLRRIHWHRRTTVQPRSCMSPSLWQTTLTPPPKKQTKKKTTLVPGRTLKSHTAESKRIPIDRQGENCEEESA